METAVMGGITIAPEKVKKAASVLRAVNHKLRQRIIRLIDTHGRMAVSEIYKKLRLEQSVTSQHLSVLRGSGIVVTQREGRFIYYSVNYEKLELIDEVAGRLLNQKEA